MNNKKIIKALSVSFFALASVFALAACKKKTTTSKVTTSNNLSTDVVTPEKAGYNILWSDEFNGTTLDSTIWNKTFQQPGWVNAELQKYTKDDENSFVRDGNLVIKGIKDQNWNYTSAKLTATSKSFKYGRVEVSAKVPEGKGIWPAIWMLSKDGAYGEWPKSGEIDIMEILCDNVTKTHGTIHYYDSESEGHLQQQGNYVLTNGTFADSFHEFAVEWEPGVLVFYIDGVEYYRVDEWTCNVGDSTYPAPFDEEFYLILNMAIGGTWPGNPDDDQDFSNCEFLVDYVRVYQKDSYDESAVKKPEVKKLDFKKADETGNFITNGNFAAAINSKTDFEFMTQMSGAAKQTVADNKITIDITKAGTVDYAVQLMQAKLPAEKGKKYKVSFDAYADEETSMIVKVNGPDRNWTNYSKENNIKLTTELESYSFEFIMSGNSDDNARLDFNMGDQKATKIYISNVRYEEVTNESGSIYDFKKADETGNFITNGNFATAIDGSFTFNVSDSLNGAATQTVADNMLTVDVTAIGDEKWAIQLYQTGLPCEKGKKYTISFDAYADVATSIVVGLGQNGGEYKQYANTSFDLTTESKNFTYTFTMSENTDDNAKLDFNLGKSKVTKYYITNIRYEEVKAGDTPTYDFKKADATGNFITNGNFADDTKGFVFGSQEGGDAECQVIDNELVITVTEEGNYPYSVQLYQATLPCENGKTYKISFDAYTDSEATIQYSVGQNGGSYAYYGGGSAVLTTTKTSYEATFTMDKDTDDKAKLDINCGKTGATKVYITNIRYEEVTV